MEKSSNAYLNFSQGGVTMYHTLASQQTKDFVERNPNLKSLAREMCHKFNAFVMTYDMNPDAEPVYEDKYSQVLLTKENGTPFCGIRAVKAVNRAQEPVINYIVLSPMILKNKGRGADRMTRESTNIKALMKVLEKDYDNNAVKLDMNDVISHHMNIDRDLSYSAETITKSSYSDRLSFNYETCKQILESQFENKPLSIPTVEYLKTAYEKYLKDQEKLEKTREIVRRFITDCYLVVRYEFCPAIVMKVSLSKENYTDPLKIKVHDGMKPYSSMEALANDYPDLAISLKMFNTRHDLNKDVSSRKGKNLFPIINDLPWAVDKLDAELDVFTSAKGYTGLGRFNSVQLILTPILTPIINHD
jgi:hypothetical protein